ncbi:MAG: neutral/alkaline non-lysosomal ceramidase N-terminal domain-containing protein [Cyanobacteriota bacterium]
MIKFGCASKNITPDVTGVQMMGWGKFENIAFGVALPIHSRAFVFESDNKKIAFVSAEIAFISQSIKQGVIDFINKNYPEKNFNDDNIMLSATHTHSAFGGFSHYLLYLLTSKGYSKEIYQTYVEGIAKSIIEADNNLTDSKLSFSIQEIPENEPVAFNRVVKAYNQNPEVKNLEENQANLAIDRNIYLIKVYNQNNLPLGMINWFAVHCTSIHNDNYLIHSDNKGCASTDFEKELKKENIDFIAGFAQSSCGDVTPNFKKYDGSPFQRGISEDDFISAELNGKIQSKYAKKAFDNPLFEIEGKIDFYQKYFDFSNMKVDPKFCNGLENIYTTKQAIGIEMIGGTKEGPGISEQLLSVLKSVLKISKSDILSRKNDDKKIVFANMHDRTIMGKNIKNVSLPKNIDEMIPLLKKMDEKGALDISSWTPNILPIQLLLLGKIAIIGLPAEFTTISGKRVKKLILDKLEKIGIEQVIVSCYTNSYSGYVTTPEEYDMQFYEGASTHFGKWTLSAYQTCIEKLCDEILKPEEEREKNNLSPRIFDEKDLEKLNLEYYVK